MTDAALDRLNLAEAFVQEAVYRSRDTQASGTLLSAGSANCGLGEKAAVDLDLTERGAELLAALWPDGLGSTETERVREVLAAWVRKQDGLDRKRNHFLKDFRHEHGFDRAQYDAQQQADYRAGLDAVNAEVDAGRRTAAQALIEPN